MTPATSQSLRKQIGSAIWLFALLGYLAPADWTGDTAVYIANGNIATGSPYSPPAPRPQ
jgi:hypothetical protein